MCSCCCLVVLLTDLDACVNVHIVVCALHVHICVCVSTSVLNCLHVFSCFIFSVRLVIAWGVFLPSLGTERGVGNRYTPLHSLRIGRCAVSAIHTDNTHGILACGDVSGEVVVWEVVDDKQTPALGACAKLRREKVMAQYRAAVSGVLLFVRYALVLALSDESGRFFGVIS